LRLRVLGSQYCAASMPRLLLPWSEPGGDQYVTVLRFDQNIPTTSQSILSEVDILCDGLSLLLFCETLKREQSGMKCVRQSE
jgi:hypothetical protein